MIETKRMDPPNRIIDYRQENKGGNNLGNEIQTSQVDWLNDDNKNIDISDKDLQNLLHQYYTSQFRHAMFYMEEKPDYVKLNRVFCCFRHCSKL